MSSIPFVELDDLDGSDRFIRTKGFVNWIDDVSTYRPYQRVGLGDSSVDGHVVCTVWTDEIELEEGVGYRFGGVDDVYEAGKEVQLKLYDNCWADRFWPQE
jgi:hypothetical protein